MKMIDDHQYHLHKDQQLVFHVKEILMDQQVVKNEIVHDSYELLIHVQEHFYLVILQ